MGATLMGETLRRALMAGLVSGVVLSSAPSGLQAAGFRASDAAGAGPRIPAAQDAASGEAATPDLELAQSGSQQQGETLQFGAPAAPPATGPGQTLQIGSPPPGGPTLQIGAPPPSAPGAPTMAPPEPRRTVEFSIPWVRAEGGWLVDGGSRADAAGYLSGAVRADIRPPGMDAWSLQATVRGDSYPQTGRFDDGTTRLDYGDTFVRYDGARTRITVGAQTVPWGRVDEIPPTDRMSVQDLTRFTLDEEADRRRAVPALRLEHTIDQLEVDVQVMPWFRPAELPDQDSLWFPVRREDGRIAGIRNPFPLYTAAIRSGTVGEADDFESFGGAGLRLGRRGAGFDAAATVQRVRHSLPYYQLDPAVRAAVLQGQSLGAALAAGTGPTFREVHPLTWLVGGDLAMEALGGTVRLEAAWLSDVPVTTLDARLETHAGLDWVGGYEFFPGDGNTRITLQLAGHQVFDAPITLDRRHVYAFLGEMEMPFAQERWLFQTRWTLGLNDRDVYINPKLSYVGWDAHEVYVGAHLFSGSERTFNGFYARNDMIVVGWRAQF